VRALTSDAAGAREIREAVTLTVVPRVNVDGFDATPTGDPWRQNVDPFDCTMCPAFYARGRGGGR
jgi:murein tripeptide amidase MpaA